MKKSLALLIIFVLFVNLFILSSVSLVSATPDLGQLEEGKEQIETLTEQDYWNEKWDYLGQEWKKIFLKNPVISALDSFFTNISIVFRILFGVPYSMSLVLLGVIFLWVVIAFDAGRIISAYNLLKGWMAYVGWALLAIVLAQVKVFEYIILFLGRLAFAPSHWMARTAIILGLISGFFVYEAFMSLLNKYLIDMKAAAKKHSAEFAE